MDNAAFRKLSVLFWNMQGLGDPDKCGLVRDALVAADPSVACLQESKLADVDAQKACSFLPSRLSPFVAKNADGRRGEILTAWDPALFDLVSSSSSVFSLTVVLASTTSPLSFAITNVYAPSDHSLTAEFAADLSAVAATISVAWLVLGDFNLIHFPHEKNNPNFDVPHAATFNGLINSTSWFELPLSDRLCTWLNKRSPPYPCSARPSVFQC